MALSNNGVTTAQPESGAAIAVKPESPTRSSIAGFTGYSDVAQDVRQGANASQQSDYSSRSSLNLELPQFQQASANEAAKEAATHDFLSRCGNTSSAGQMQTPPVRGLASVTTQDFLQPLEECGKTAGASLLSQGSRPTSVPGNRLRKSGADNHERLENLSYWPNVQLKFGASELGYDTKTTPSHAYLEIGQQYQSNLTKQWQQAGSELIDVAKKPWRAPSEDDEDEDDECPDGSQDQRKNSLSQKGDTSQKLEGKNDVRGSTSRSKHSATEQRRRSKINDRFQMLRQLVPNNDQKRDKASFLLEVIEYIQFLQEKVRKNEAAEHGRQQERLKNMPWDACQMGTTVDAQRLDSLMYGKEHIPVVSTVPFDIMQATDANCVIRPVLTSVAGATDHEVGASDLLANMGHVTMHLDRTVQASQGSHPSYENVSIILKPKTTMTLPIPPAVHRVYGASSAHFFHSGPLPAPAAHVVSRHLSLPEEQVVQPFPKLKSTFHASHSSHLHGSNPPLSQSTVHADDQYHLELKARQSHNFEQEANSGQQSRETFNAIPDSELQLSCTGLPSRQLSNGNIAVSISTSDLHNPIVPQSESLQRVEVQADGQEPLVIHGGVINVSSVYSQGLLDTLARALQSSGLDLSQASISVQIDLGKPGGVAVATNCAEAVNPGMLQESQGPSRHAGGLPELEHVKKKPKVEADS